MSQALWSMGLYQCPWRRSFTLLGSIIWLHECREIPWDFRATYAAFKMTKFPDMLMYFQKGQFCSRHTLRILKRKIRQWQPIQLNIWGHVKRKKERDDIKSERLHHLASTMPEWLLSVMRIKWGHDRAVKASQLQLLLECIAPLKCKNGYIFTEKCGTSSPVCILRWVTENQFKKVEWRR